MTYLEKLRDPRWQRKRLEIMAFDQFSCRGCGDATSTLNVHHVVYLPGRDPWEYENCYLMTLCEACHTEQHAAMHDLALICANYSTQFLDGVVRFAHERHEWMVRVGKDMDIENWPEEA
jgi:hypothetical protein